MKENKSIGFFFLVVRNCTDLQFWILFVIISTVSEQVTVKQVVSYTMPMETINNHTYCKQVI